MRSGRKQQRNLLQVSAALPPVSYLLAGECIQATTADSWLSSPNLQYSLVISTSGMATMYYTEPNGDLPLAVAQWTTPAPTRALAAGQPVSLCLENTGRVVVKGFYEGDGESQADLAVLYGGLPTRIPGNVAAFVQDDGWFVVYTPRCNRLAVAEPLSWDKPWVEPSPCFALLTDV